MSAVHAKPVVDQDPVQVIDRRAFGLRVAHEWRQINCLVKVHMLGDFPTRSAKLESLQLYDEGIGRGLDCHSLNRLDHLVLFRALVAVLAVEHLPRREPLQRPLNAVRPRDFQREVQERVVGVRLVIALRALELRPDLPAEDLVDERCVLELPTGLGVHAIDAPVVHGVQQRNQVLMRVFLPTQSKPMRASCVRHQWWVSCHADAARGATCSSSVKPQTIDQAAYVSVTMTIKQHPCHECSQNAASMTHSYSLSSSTR